MTKRENSMAILNRKQPDYYGDFIWHGAIAQNDICEIQRITGGKQPMIGGVEEPKIDVLNISEAEIGAEVLRAIDTYCPGGSFFPAIPNGWCFNEWNQKIFSRMSLRNTENNGHWNIP